MTLSRISNSLLTSRYLSDLRQVQVQIARLLRQTSTGLSFERPSDDPAAVAVSLDLHSALKYLYQYNRNVDDGISRLQYTESAVYEVDTQLQRARELTVQAANSYLTRSDRRAIAEEMDQLLEHTITLSNANFRGRYIFSGYETLSKSFALNSNTVDGLTNSVTYRGDYGRIDRNIGIERDLQVNFTGKETFIEQTYTLTGRQLASGKLNYSGAFEINDHLFVVTPEMSLADIRDMILAEPDVEVYARIESDYRLVLESLNSCNHIKVRDISGNVLRDLGILPLGAFNLARSGPALPLTDSVGALHRNDTLAPPPGFPLTIGTGNQDLVITLSGTANDGFTQTEALKLVAITYNTIGELVAEIQQKADLAFGEDKLIVRDAGGGVIAMETYVQSSTVLASDFRLGGTAPDGTVDTASAFLGFNNAGLGPWNADSAGVDGNDRFTIDLGLSAYRVSSDEEPVDLPPIEINIDATVAVTISALVADINDKILDNTYLSGLVEAVNDGGRVRIQTTKQGSEISANDLILANAVPGAVTDPPGPADPWDTLRALGFYRDPTTGISTPPQPAAVQGTAAFPPGIAVAAGTNVLTIDLGPAASIDGTNPDPIQLTVTPGAYGGAAAFAAELNSQISRSALLRDSVTAQVRTVGAVDYVDIVTTEAGSHVQAGDLVLADDPSAPGTLVALGLAAPTIPGGGTAAGQGDILLPENLINTLIQVRDELHGYAARSSRLTDLLDEDSQGLGLFPGDTIRINSDGSSLEFKVQRFTTMQDLADKIEEKLGFQLEVCVLRDGKIEVFNPTTSVINDISIEALDRNGTNITAFEAKFANISGKLFYRGELRSSTVYEDERFSNMTQRIGDMDAGMETILSTLAVIGSRHRRLEMTIDQNEKVEVNLSELQSENDTVDMAETIIKLKEHENVLKAALGAGARVLPPTLFDFMR